MKIILKWIFATSLILTTYQIQAQIIRRPSPRIEERNKDNNEEESKYDVLTADIKIGNLGFFGNLFLSGKGNVGYQITPWLNAGIGGKVFYTQIFVPSAPDSKYTDLGGFTYARAKVFRNFFAQVEYHYTSFDYVTPLLTGANISYPTIGAGYVSGNGPWKFGIELNFLVNELARDYQGSVLEYWTGAFYHF